jgi:hypothetical protein
LGAGSSFNFQQGDFSRSLHGFGHVSLILIMYYEKRTATEKYSPQVSGYAFCVQSKALVFSDNGGVGQVFTADLYGAVTSGSCWRSGSGGYFRQTSFPDSVAAQRFPVLT